MVGLLLQLLLLYKVNAIIPIAHFVDSATYTWRTIPTTGCRARSTSLWVHRNLFWQLSRDGNLHVSGISHATAASPKPSFRVPWRLGEAVVGRGNAGGTSSKSGHPCPCQNCSQGPPAEKAGGGSLLNRPSCPPDDPIGHGIEQKWSYSDKVQSLLTLYQPHR